MISTKIPSGGYLVMPLYINRSITEKFSIKTLSEMIDLTFPRFLILESTISERVLIENFFVIDRFMYSGNGR